MRVLVAEKIGASGVALLREHFDVDEGDHLDRIDEYDGILIRSATKLTADVIGRATRLKAIGRAGVGVDNVDVPAATKRGIVVANAPQSTSSPPPSTPWRCCSPWRATSPRPTPA